MPVSSSDRPVAAASKNAAKPSPAQQALRKLGLVRDIDLALHLPLRYEDETRITLLASAREGDAGADRGHCDRLRGAIAPAADAQNQVDDGSASCQLTFFSFYASQQKPWPWARAGAFAARSKAVFGGGKCCTPPFERPKGRCPRPSPRFTLVAHGLPQAYMRRAVASALQRVALPETLPAARTAACS